MLISYAILNVRYIKKEARRQRLCPFPHDINIHIYTGGVLHFLHCFTVLCLWPSRPRGLTQANRRTGNASRTLSRHWGFFLILESWLCATYALMTYQNPQILAVLIKVNLLQVYSMYTGIQSSPSWSSPTKDHGWN